MIKYRATRPYNNGRPVFNKRGRSGVYVIIKNGKPLYVGFSQSDLYKTMYRHFQSWNDRRQFRAVYNPTDPDIKVRVVYTRTPAQALKLEQALIVKLQPRDNNQKINFDLTPQENRTFDHYEDVTPIHVSNEEAPF